MSTFTKTVRGQFMTKQSPTDNSSAFLAKCSADLHFWQTAFRLFDKMGLMMDCLLTQVSERESDTLILSRRLCSMQLDLMWELDGCWWWPPDTDKCVVGSLHCNLQDQDCHYFGGIVINAKPRLQLCSVRQKVWPRQYLVWHSGECKSVVSHFAPVKSLPLTPNNRGVGDLAMARDRKSITPSQPLYQLHPPPSSLHPHIPLTVRHGGRVLQPAGNYTPPLPHQWRSTVHTTTLINRPSACGTTADEVLITLSRLTCM